MEQHVALYLQSIANCNSVVEEVVNAINWVHTLVGLEFPAHSTFVQATVEFIFGNI